MSGLDTLRRLFDDMSRVLWPRGSFVLAKSAGAFVFASSAALGMLVSTLPLALAGHGDLAVYPAMGALTATFERGLPHRHRLRTLALVAVAMTAVVGAGCALAVLTGSGRTWVGAAGVVVGMAVVAGLAKFGCDATGVRGLGAVLMLFSFAVAASSSPAPADVLPRTALAAIGAGAVWLLAFAGWSLRPDGLQRLAVLEALRAVATLLETENPDGIAPARHQATGAVLRAQRSLGLEPATAPHTADRNDTLVVLADLTWALLVHSTRRPLPDPPVARWLRQQARAINHRRRKLPPPLPGMPVPQAVHGEDSIPAVPCSPASTGRRSSTEHRIAALVMPAFRTAVGTGVAGGLALFFGLGHSYWAAITAAAVLHSLNVFSTMQRAVQRTVGTAVGLLLAGVILVMHPGAVAIVCVIIVFDFLLEYFAFRNYGLAVVFLTPLALLLSELITPSSIQELLHDRVAGSALGIGTGLVCALLLVHSGAAARVRHALSTCVAVADRAEAALPGPSEQRRAAQQELAAVLVELREADDVAAGELWSSGIDPAEVMAAERRAYGLLSRLESA